MNHFTTDDLRRMFLFSAGELVKNEPVLTEIDSKVGDGDHGIGMKIGFTAVEKELSQNRFDTVGDLLRAVGLSLIRSMGGASGVLFGTLFIAGLEDFPPMTEIDCAALADFFARSARSVAARGRSAPGDRTMLDALFPAVDAWKAAADFGVDAVSCLKAAAEAARHGVQETKAMRPRVGRAKNFSDLSLGVPDAGAVSVSILFDAMYRFCAGSGLDS